MKNIMSFIVVVKTTTLLLLLLLLLLTYSAAATAAARSSTRHRIPVVGILAQPTSTSTSFDYIAASYAKWCEAGGATTIAVPYNATNLTVYDDMLPYMDGLLLPGGAAPLSTGVHYLLDRIRHLNSVDDNGDGGRYFPVWGTCLGFEFLLRSIGGVELSNNFVARDVNLPLEQVQRHELYSDLSLYEAAIDHNITLNNHQYGITPEAFAADAVLSSYWYASSISHDEIGQAFVSTIEPVDPDRFPFYGVQYHPEKNVFEYGIHPQTGELFGDFAHSAVGVMFSLGLAQFWIGKVRQAAHQRQQQPNKNGAAAASAVAAWSPLYPPLYTFDMHAGVQFQQVYLIPKDYPETAGGFTSTRNSNSKNNRPPLDGIMQREKEKKESSFNARQIRPEMIHNDQNKKLRQSTTTSSSTSITTTTRFARRTSVLRTQMANNNRRPEKRVALLSFPMKRITSLIQKKKKTRLGMTKSTPLRTSLRTHEKKKAEVLV